MTGLEPLVVPLMIAGAGVSAYGAYQAGVDAKAQAQQQAAFAEYNSKVAKQQAEAQRMANQEASKQHARKAAMALSTMRAQVGKSGVAMSGSPLLVMEDTANQLELERSWTLASGEAQARAYEQQSILDTARAGAYRKQGSAAYTSGILGGIGSGLSGLASAGYYKSQLN